MFIFVSSSSEDIDAILITFDALTSDHYYMVRKTIACGIHEVRLNTFIIFIYIVLYKYTIYMYINNYL